MMLEVELRILSGVMRGLDPRIHEESPDLTTLRLSLRGSLMDCRVKPGNDNREMVRTIQCMAGSA
jgi:hypothetical protein